MVKNNDDNNNYTYVLISLEFTISSQLSNCTKCLTKPT